MFCKLYNSNPFLFSETFSFRSYHFSETFYRNVLTNGKRSRSWFWMCSAQPTIVVSPIKQLGLHHLSAKLLNSCLLNARSINNKSLQIKHNLVDKSIDILALAETWLRANECSDFIIRDISPTRYPFVHIMPLGLVALAEALACSIEKTWKLNSWKLFLNRLNLRNYYSVKRIYYPYCFFLSTATLSQEWSDICFVFRWIFHVTWATSICLW